MAVGCAPAPSAALLSRSMLMCSAGGAAAACDMVGSGSMCVLQQAAQGGVRLTRVSLSHYFYSIKRHQHRSLSHKNVSNHV
jgi:hypothetical protein